MVGYYLEYLRSVTMKKKFIFIIIFLFIILAIIIVFALKGNSYVKSFDYKFSLLQNNFENSINDIDNQLDESIVAISICDNKHKAIVKSKIGTSTDNTLKDVVNEAKKYIKENNYSTESIKIDFANYIEEISTDDLSSEFSYYGFDNSFRYGLVFCYENRDDIILTEAELNSNMIIDYDNFKIDLKNLNNYLTSCGQNSVASLPSTCTAFTTISYFIDSDNKVYEIGQDFKDIGRRNITSLDAENVENIISNASNYLANMIQENGKFIYGYYPLTDTEINGYNILRHAGSIWSLIIMYNGENGLKEKIDSAFNYLMSHIQYFNDTTAYVNEEDIDEIKLGGNALSLIALCEYTDKFEDTKYLDLLEKLGNGILSMQNDNGSFIHVLNSSDFSLKENFRTVYYDGEATFALCKLYGITRDAKYLDGAKRAFNYFIANDYTTYGDHWISYTANEITKYIDDEAF